MEKSQVIHKACLQRGSSDYGRMQCIPYEFRSQSLHYSSGKEPGRFVGGSLFIKKSAGVRLYEVIAVYKPDIFSMGMGKTVISCPADAVVLCGKYKSFSGFND